MEKQTLGEITAQKLVRMIQERGYVPGDKLPTEMEPVSYTHLDVYKRQG